MRSYRPRDKHEKCGGYVVTLSEIRENIEYIYIIKTRFSINIPTANIA